MVDRLSIIINSIKSIEYAEIITPFELDGEVIKGAVSITAGEVKLDFKVKIYQQYPLQFHDTETIRFFNKKLITYDHVNADGSICIHTSHSPLLERKIGFDFHSLRHWITRYYINEEKDRHYEHIVVPEKSFNGIYQSFLFTETDLRFVNGQFGHFKYSTISTGSYKESVIDTHIVQEFHFKRIIEKCKWSPYYQNNEKEEGIYYFMEAAPVVNQRFAISNWKQLEPLVSQEFFRFLYNKEKQWKAGPNKKVEIPFLIGYRINEIEIHWQVILMPVNSLPFYQETIRGMSNAIGRFDDQEIIWAQTRNCSFQYFFGRGALHKKFTEGKVLIIGLGAIGSQVATTLVRGGCRKLHIFDYDIKEAENVCRSEYWVRSGIRKKVDELASILSAISPFVDINMSEQLMDITKYVMNDPVRKNSLQNLFNEYDIIFDCTTDNDVAYILDEMEVRGEIFNLSITNHAKELVCVAKPNVYNWVIEIFERLNNDTSDLYRPTGCWSPTFKAGYNDISVLVQYALKHINNCIVKEQPIRNFYLSTDAGNDVNIKLNQF